MMYKLFSYGTLQYEQVQKELFGRLLEGEDDVLCGYVVADLKIQDAEVIRKSGTDIHPILQSTGKISDEVEGTIYQVTEEELEQADKYEIKDYSRIEVRFKSGVSAWVYAAASDLEK